MMLGMESRIPEYGSEMFMHQTADRFTQEPIIEDLEIFSPQINSETDFVSQPIASAREYEQAPQPEEIHLPESLTPLEVTRN